MSSAQAVGKASQQKYVLADSAPQRILKSELVFIDDTPKSAAKDGPRRKAQRKLIRSHATRASTHARLETTRRRAESKSDRQPGQGIFRIQDERLPLATKLVEQKDRTLIRRYSYRGKNNHHFGHLCSGSNINLPASQTGRLLLSCMRKHCWEDPFLRLKRVLPFWVISCVASRLGVPPPQTAHG